MMFRRIPMGSNRPCFHSKPGFQSRAGLPKRRSARLQRQRGRDPFLASRQGEARRWHRRALLPGRIRAISGPSSAGDPAVGSSRAANRAVGDLTPISASIHRWLTPGEVLACASLDPQLPRRGYSLINADGTLSRASMATGEPVPARAVTAAGATGARAAVAQPRSTPPRLVRGRGGGSWVDRGRPASTARPVAEVHHAVREPPPVAELKVQADTVRHHLDHNPRERVAPRSTSPSQERLLAPPCAEFRSD